MGCASESSLQRFLEGTLSPPAASALQDHLSGCDACRELLAGAARETLPEHDASEAAPDSAKGEPALGAPRTVGRYQVGEPIGAGGMGVVYAARDPKLDRPIAIKILRTAIFRGLPEARALVLREARAMAKLAHPNVLAVHDVGELGDTLFVAMELVEGGTLAAWLRERPRPWTEVLDAFLAAARGLEAAHAAGLVHRDFKPDNVLVGQDGRVRVTDFGLALPSSAREPASGSPPYMAPEQRRGEPADARADVYSFCVALHEGLAGERPKDGLVSARVPKALRASLARGLSATPAARQPSMLALRSELERLRSAPRRRLVLAAATSAFALVAVLSALLVHERQQRGALVERKGQLDTRIAATLAAMDGEKPPGRLVALERDLGSLTDDARRALAELRRKGGEPKPTPADRLDVHIAELLKKFGAETYAVPPLFRETLRRHIELIVRGKDLPAARERMARWMPVLRRELAARGLPAELAYVPWTESHYTPEARSPTGAYGLWQFTAGTARLFGLVVDDKVDERADGEKSSRAAAAYLASLLADFGRDSFMLALASYNLGEHKMRKVLHTLALGPGGLRPEERDFWHLYRLKLLPEETREYVPGVLAAAIVFEHPADYFK